MESDQNASQGADPGTGLLEQLSAQMSALTEQMTDMDRRVRGVEVGTGRKPLEVQLSPESVSQIADAVARLQAAGTRALEGAFSANSDELAEALSGLVRAEVSRTLTDAGYSVEVVDGFAQAQDVDVEDGDGDDDGDDDEEESWEHEVWAELNDANEADLEALSEALAAGENQAEVGVVPDAHELAVEFGAAPGSDREPDSEFDPDSDVDPEWENFFGQPERAPLTLADLDDPFLEALINKEPLSA